MISIIVPVFNEEKNIRQTLQQLHSTLKQLCGEYEIIVVNDGSSDNTMQALAEIDGVQIISYPHNCGKGYAIKKGLARAKGSLIGYIDGDGEISPVYLQAFYAEMKQGKYDIAVGKKITLKKNLLRKGYSQAFKFFSRVLFGIEVETQTGIKLFTGRVKNFYNSCSNGYIFDLELLIFCQEKQLRITEVPIVLNNGKKPNRIKLRQAFKILGDMIMLKIRRLTCSDQESYGCSLSS